LIINNENQNLIKTNELNSVYNKEGKSIENDLNLIINKNNELKNDYLNFSNLENENINITEKNDLIKPIKTNNTNIEQFIFKKEIIPNQNSDNFYQFDNTNLNVNDFINYINSPSNENYTYSTNTTSNKCYTHIHNIIKNECSINNNTSTKSFDFQTDENLNNIMNIDDDSNINIKNIITIENKKEKKISNLKNFISNKNNSPYDTDNNQMYNDSIDLINKTNQKYTSFLNNKNIKNSINNNTINENDVVIFESSNITKGKCNDIFSKHNYSKITSNSHNIKSKEDSIIFNNNNDINNKNDFDTKYNIINNDKIKPHPNNSESEFNNKNSDIVDKFSEIKIIKNSNVKNSNENFTNVEKCNSLRLKNSSMYNIRKKFYYNNI